mmetsp:Transcript_23786/g.62688  ORF Transcript_23786/g.62688 Transcript_23786/m.62688 type:complete len:649 (+) Transcript_23786:2-1948(+)
MASLAGHLKRQVSYTAGGRGGIFVEDVESAVDVDQDKSVEPVSGTNGLAYNSDDDSASLAEAKFIAREKFDWLTSHSLVAQTRSPSGQDLGMLVDLKALHGIADSSAGLQQLVQLQRVPSNLSQSLPRGGHQRVPSQTVDPTESMLHQDVENGGSRGSDDDAGSPQERRSPEQTTFADRTMACPGSYRSAARYLAACARYSLQPNGGALLCLSLGLEMLEVDGTLTNLELVPLCASLLEATFVSHLKLSGHPVQDTGAAVLALALPGCPWIQELELIGCNITGAGARSLCEALPKSGIRKLVLRGNMLRQNPILANNALEAVVERSARLEHLDLQASGITSLGMRQIKRAQNQRLQKGLPACNVDFEGNFMLVEVLNSVTHGACALICLEAWRRLNSLIVRLCHFESRVAVTLYIASMLAMFMGSTLYHSTFAVTDLSWFFRMIDHCAIYFLIAGTYTPVLVMGCRSPETLEIMPMVPVWTSLYWGTVTVGVIMETIFAPRKPAWYSKFILTMYVLLGFGGVPYVASCPLVRDADVMVWIELGGLTYVIGIVFFLLDKRYPAMHVVWHLLVGLAAFFHFVAVWNLTNEVLSDSHRHCTDANNAMWGYAIFSDYVPPPPPPPQSIWGLPVNGTGANVVALTPQVSREQL